VGAFHQEREKQVLPNRWCPRTKQDDVKPSSIASFSPLNLYLVKTKESKAMLWLLTPSSFVFQPIE